MAITETLGQTVIADLFEVLDRAGVRAGMANPGVEIPTAPLRAKLPDIIKAAAEELDRRKEAHETTLDERLADPADRLEAWVDESRQLAFRLDERRRRDRDRHTREVRTDTEALIESMRTSGRPLIRVLAVLVPRGAGQ
jgi:hypothetical protein